MSVHGLTSKRSSISSNKNFWKLRNHGKELRFPQRISVQKKAELHTKNNNRKNVSFRIIFWSFSAYFKSEKQQ